jgi:hypothetical protein
MENEPRDKERYAEVETQTRDFEGSGRADLTVPVPAKECCQRGLHFSRAHVREVRPRPCKGLKPSRPWLRTGPREFNRSRRSRTAPGWRASHRACRQRERRLHRAMTRLLGHIILCLKPQHTLGDMTHCLAPCME